MALWYILIVFAVIFFSALEFFLLPGFLLRQKLVKPATSSFGVRQIREPEARTMILNPCGKTAEYIESYAMTDRDGKKVLLCKLKEGIRYIVYTVTAFDKCDRELDYIRVKELPDGIFTAELPLPAETVYISITVNHVNNTYLTRGPVRCIPTGNALIYCFLLLVLTYAEMFIIRFCALKIYAGIFFETFIGDAQYNLVYYTVSLAACAVLAIVSFIIIKARRSAE